MIDATTISETLYTAEQYSALPDGGKLTELVRGRIVEILGPTPSHGYVCANISGALRDFVRPRELGRVVSNDSGVKTEQGPIPCEVQTSHSIATTAFREDHYRLAIGRALNWCLR